MDWANRDYNIGGLQFGILKSKLDTLVEATAIAGQKKAVASTRRDGRESDFWGILEIAFGLVLADIWCRYTGTDFSASANEIGTGESDREASQSVIFMNQVLDELIGKIAPRSTVFSSREGRMHLFNAIRNRRKTAADELMKRKIATSDSARR